MSLPSWIHLMVCPQIMHLTCSNKGCSIEGGDTFAFIDDEPMCRECLSMFNE